ncbi:MAG: hypothetical protein ABIQ18_33120 [Umezawaea sp.]
MEEHSPMLSPVHEQWSRLLTELPLERVRAQVRHIEQAAAELGVWERGGFVPVQPFVLDAAANRDLHDISYRLKELIVGHARSTSGGDLGRLADVVEWPEDDRWFLGGAQPLSEAIATVRPDVFISGGRPRVLEVNIGTCLNGGTSASVLSQAMLDSPVGREFADAVTAHSYLDELVEFVRQRYSGAASNIALLAYADDGDEGSLRWAEDHTTRFARHGIPCEFVPIDEAEIVDGHLTWRGKRYGLAIRYFMVPPNRAHHVEFLTALHNATGTVLIGSYAAQLFTSKNLVADLFQDDRLTAAERALLDHVPWTARLRPGRARRGDALVDPVEWAAANRELAVVKPANLFGGRGLVVGHLTDEAAWRSALEGAVADGGHVVQELVRPDPWPNLYWDNGSEELVAVNAPALLGPFLVGPADGGVYLQQPIRGTEDDFLDRERAVSLGCAVVS